MNDTTKINKLYNIVSHSQSGTQFDFSFLIFIIFGVTLFLIGCILYFYIWKKNKDELPDSKNWRKSLSYIISFTPSGDVLKPIIAGVFVTVGLGLAIGYSIGYFLNSINFTYHSSAVTVSSGLFSVFIALITFWTLNQTKKIEHQQGHKIVEFKTLINRLNDEISKLEKSFRNDYKNDAQYFHRLYYITDHPFFGAMSYPDEDATKDLQLNLEKIKKIIKYNKETKFKFEIICCNLGGITKFITEYYNSVTPDAIKTEKIKTAIEFFESNIEEYTHLKIATRVNDVPTFPQFMIIGNTLFEFIIEAKNPQTQIVETQVITDKKRCDIYIKTFELLKDRLAKNNSH